ncbi:MAG TPA: cytochrome c [Longimicrobiales bacterium]
MGQRRSSAFTMAAVLVLAACGGGDAGDQTEPADDMGPDTSAAAPTTPSSTVGANVELPEGVTQAMVAEGEQIFNQQICFTCHGANGVGTTLGPPMTDQEWLNIDGSYEAIIEVVRTGVVQPVQYPSPMPAMGGIQLSEDQIRAVAAYVYALSRGG